MRWNLFPFVRYTLALSGGILLYQFHFIPHKAFLCIISLSFLGLIGLQFTPVRIKWTSGLAGMFLLIGLGGILTFLHDERQASSHFIHYQEPIVAYQAVISSAVEKKNSTFRAIADINQVRIGTHWRAATGKVLLFIDRNISHKPAYGDVILVRKTPELVEPPYNPDEFNYRDYLANQGIYHQQYLHKYDFRQLKSEPFSSIVNLAVTVNEKAASLLSENLPSRPEYAVAAAMLLGTRDELDNDLLRAYSAAGAIHTLSVSGMHVGILFLVLSWLLSPLRKGTLPQKWIFAMLVTGFLWGYALLTGLSAPVLRSAIMLSVFVWRDTFRLSGNSFNTLALSAFIILLFSPYSLFQMGFQLSYLSVAGIMYLYPKLHWLWKSKNPLWAELWSLSCGAVAAQLVTFPLAVYYFHQFPTYFLWVNPLVMAFSSLGLIVGMAYLIFAGIPVLNTFLLYVLKLSFGTLNVVVKETEQLPGAIWNHLVISPIQLFLIYGILLCICLLFTKRQKGYVWISLGLAAAFFLSKIQAFAQHRQQQIIAVHHLKKHTAISLIKGRELVFLADSSLYLDQRTQALHLVPFWTTHDIRKKDFVVDSAYCRPIPYGRFITWQSKRIAWVDEEIPRYTSWSINQPLDFLIITNNSIRYPGNWLQLLRINQIVLDATNSESVNKRWLEICKKLQIPCYDVRSQGAFLHKY